MMWIIQAVVIALAAVATVTTQSADYTGYKVLKFELENAEQLRFLSSYQSVPQFIYDDHPMSVGRASTVAVPPHYVDHVTSRADQLHLPYTVIYHDLQTVINLEKEGSLQKSNVDNFNFDIFNTYEDIIAQIDAWVASCPAGLSCEQYTYGQTAEGRDIVMLHVGTEAGSNNAYWMHGVTHSREWLGTATLLKVIDRFWTGYGSDPEVDHLLNNYDWYFTPVHNADGYEYTWTDDRLWRKSRGVNGESSCFGTDLNRNYDSEWGEEGVSHDPCHYELYCGDGPESAVETQVITAEVERVAGEKNLLAFVDMHTFGEMILMPFGFSEEHDGVDCVPAPNRDEHLQITNAFADAIQDTFGETEWIRGPPCEILYGASGGSMDWAIVDGGALYGFGTELRGPYFALDPIHIDLSYQEYWNGINAMVSTIEDIEGI